MDPYSLTNKLDEEDPEDIFVEAVCQECGMYLEEGELNMCSDCRKEEL